MIKAPIIVPQIVPTPPERLVPPMTAEAMHPIQSQLPVRVAQNQFARKAPTRQTREQASNRINANFDPAYVQARNQRACSFPPTA